MTCRARFRALVAVVAAMASYVGTAPVSWAVDLVNIARPAALDQPQINAALYRNLGQQPIRFDFGGIQTFNIQAFLDTGSSGILLSNSTADFLEIVRATHAGQLIEFGDIGVGGTDLFNVSEELYVALAPFQEGTDIDNLATHATVYNQVTTKLRTQIGPLSENPNPLLEGLDIIGMPAMMGRTLVMDTRDTNRFAQFLADGGDIFNPPPDLVDPTIHVRLHASGAPNPNIPTPTHRVQLSYASFDQFTSVDPVGAPGPVLVHNPFIGPNPLLPPGPGAPPAVKIGFDQYTAEGSFLLDTGAAASMISEDIAELLHVFYDQNAPEDDPRLLFELPGGARVPVEDQFQLAIGGIGGEVHLAGFYLDEMLIRTLEGNAANDNDPRHLRFREGAPVLVHNIEVGGITLDGIFGMNFLVGGAELIQGPIFPEIFNITAGAFDWVTFDEPSGILGVNLNPAFDVGVLGDFNDDHIVDADDIDLLYANFGESDFDLDGDTDADQADVDFMLASILETIYGDADLDGDLDGGDFDAWRFRDTLGGAIGWATGDFDGDGDVDGGDFDLWRLRPAAIGGGALPQAVPEPASLLLLAIGLATITRRAARRPARRK